MFSKIFLIVGDVIALLNILPAGALDVNKLEADIIAGNQAGITSDMTALVQLFPPASAAVGKLLTDLGITI